MLDFKPSDYLAYWTEFHNIQFNTPINILWIIDLSVQKKTTSCQNCFFPICTQVDTHQNSRKKTNDLTMFERVVPSTPAHPHSCSKFNYKMTHNVPVISQQTFPGQDKNYAKPNSFEENKI